MVGGGGGGGEREAETEKERQRKTDRWKATEKPTKKQLHLDCLLKTNEQDTLSTKDEDLGISIICTIIITCQYHKHILLSQQHVHTFKASKQAAKIDWHIPQEHYKHEAKAKPNGTVSQHTDTSRKEDSLSPCSNPT